MQCDKATSAAKPLLRHVLKRVLLANLLLGADSVLAQDDAVFRFGGADYVAIGTHVVRHLTWSSKLPFDKSYAELTASQQAFIRDQYTGLSPEEEPPFTVDGMHAIFRIIDKSADQ